MKVSIEVRRLAKYKKKKNQRRDVTIRRYVLYANTMRAVYTNGIQKEVRRLIRICIIHMFNSYDVVIIFVILQYTNNILDLLVTIGYNIPSTVAYRSTGMELRFFPLRFNAITGSISALRFVAHSILLYHNVE